MVFAILRGLRMSVSVVDKRQAFDALRRELEYLATHHARIGVLSGSASGGNVKAGDTKKGPRRKRRGHSAEGSHLTVAEVFSFHELGLGVPKRSSIGWVADNKRQEIVTFSEKVIGAIMSGNMTGKDALMFLGEKAQSMVKARIVSGIPPELDPDYLEYKSHAGGKATPLIWTGQLLNSVRYKVEKSL